MFIRFHRVKDGRQAFYLALGYLIWSLLPHAHFLAHSHVDGELAHSHLSAHDLKLRNQTLVTANPEDAPGPALGRESSPVAPEAGLKPLDLRHGHFTQDQNILAIGRVMAAAGPLPAPRASPNFPILSPLLPYSGPAQARGPPYPA